MWESPPEKTHNGILRDYILQWKSTDGVNNRTISANDNSYNITGLTPYTEYSISIAAMTVASGPFSDEVMIRTQEDGKLKVCYLSE